MKRTSPFLVSALLVHAVIAAEPSTGGGILGPPATPSTSNTSPPVQTSPTTSANPPPNTTSDQVSSPPTTGQSSSSSAPPSSSSSQPLSPTPSPTSAPQTTPPPQPTTSLSLSTDLSGGLVTVTFTEAPSSTSDALPSATTSKRPSNSDSGLGTGSIVGMSVAAGVAVLGIIAFFVWKFTRKRMSDFDDNEAIKWPELNTHGENPDSHALPVRDTGRAGFETGSEASLSRVPSPSATYSTTDLPGGGNGVDPYAVPPLPHLNPNQPYRDDPTAPSGYYDPYRGPVPGTIENGSGEAIPMTQMSAAGRMSPGPGAAYEQYADLGRRSPGPGAAYEQYADMGRRSPGPGMAYGGAPVAGRASPGPQMAYSGRTSPGPHSAYDAYGAR